MELAVKDEDGLTEIGGWLDPLVKAASACDKFFNCAYVKKQLAEELQQEMQAQDGAVQRVLSRLDKGIEVELYRQFLFEENSIEPSTEDALASKRRRERPCDSSDIPDLQRTDS